MGLPHNHSSKLCRMKTGYLQVKKRLPDSVYGWQITTVTHSQQRYLDYTL